MAPPDPVNDAPDSLVIDRMRRRMRALRALRGFVDLSVWGLALATLTLLGARLGILSAHRAWVGLGLSAALPFVGAAVAAARRIPTLLAAQLLDAHYGLHDRLSSALEFRAQPAESRTPWMEAAIEDAVTQVRTRALDPKEALAWTWPTEARVALGLSAVLALVGVAEFRVARVIATRRPATAPSPDTLALADDDLRAFRELSRELARDAATPAARDTLREFDRFLDDVEHRRLDRNEAYRRVAAIQRSLDESAREDRDGLRESLSDMGRRMGEQSPEARALSQALQQGDTQRAREEMQRLAEQLRREQRLSEQQRQELERALQRAGEQRADPELQRRLEQARRDVEEMQRRQREHPLSQGDQDLLHRRQREAERLGHESEAEAQRRRQVEHLQREIAQAARDLQNANGGQQQAGQDLQRGAEHLSRMEDEQRSQQSLEELRQRLEELREQMRQQNGQNGQRQRQRVSRFARAASGQRAQGAGQQGGQQGNGQQGNGQQGGGQQSGGQSGNGQQGGQQGNGRGGTNGQPGGAAGSQQGGAGDPATAQGGNEPGGTQPGGAQPGGATMANVTQGQPASVQSSQGGGAGSGHEENARGGAAQTAQTNQTVQVHGQQSGNGPSRSQVIRTAASDGFASAPYRAVYAPYWDRAREVLHQGEVPAGYRSYVRRYFQLIRPRDEQ
ncbi:MAG: hypothetical protein U0326_10545 [Polyangiales bacterium]